MKNFILLLTFMPAALICQVNIKAVVCNQRNEPLALTNVVSQKSRNATITDASGNFQLLNIQMGDSIKITNVGYLPISIAVNKSHLIDTIILADNRRQLSEIKLISSRQYNSKIQLGYYQSRENAEFKLRPGNEIAVFIDNTSKREGVIKGVLLRLKQKGICENGLRIRLLTKDALNPDPFLDVMNENIIISNKQLKSSNYVDLHSQAIRMPLDGIFVVIELLYPQTTYNKDSFTSISANMQQDRNLVWLNYMDRKWSHANIPRLPNENYMTPNIGLEVAY